MDDAEAAFIVEAIEFVAARGHRFLPLYCFDPGTGRWSHREFRDDPEALSIDLAVAARDPGEPAPSLAERTRCYAACLAEAHDWAERLGEPAADPAEATTPFGDLQFFNVA